MARKCGLLSLRPKRAVVENRLKSIMCFEERREMGGVQGGVLHAQSLCGEVGGEVICEKDGWGRTRGLRTVVTVWI